MQEYYEKEFTCENATLTRGELESLPIPFCTQEATDTDMQTIINETVAETKCRMRLNTDESLDLSDDTTDRIWFEQLEHAVIRQNIPYYEDLPETKR